MLQQFTSYFYPLPDLNTFFSSLAFPIVWGRRNGIEYNYSTLSCPVRPTQLTPHFAYLFYTSLSTWCSVFLSVSLLVPVHPTVGLFFVYALLLTYPYRSSIFSVMFYVTGAPFTDPLTRSFLISSFSTTTHIYRSILISFTSSIIP